MSKSSQHPLNRKLAQLISWLFLPLYLLRLFLSSSLSLLLLLMAKLKPYSSFLISLCLFGIALLIVAHQPNPTPVLSPKETLVWDKLNKQQEKLEELLIKQPTHRDVLFNLSKISLALDQPEKAVYYQEKALELDPNSPLFSQ